MQLIDIDIENTPIPTASGLEGAVAEAVRRYLADNRACPNIDLYDLIVLEEPRPSHLASSERLTEKRASRTSEDPSSQTPRDNEIAVAHKDRIVLPTIFGLFPSHSKFAHVDAGKTITETIHTMDEVHEGEVTSDFMCQGSIESTFGFRS